MKDHCHTHAPDFRGYTDKHEVSVNRLSKKKKTKQFTVEVKN